MTLNNTKDSSIQFSICTTGLKSLTLEEIIAEARRLGLQGVEIWSGHIEDYLNRDGTLSELRALLDSNQLLVPSLSEYSYFTKSREAYQVDLACVQRSAKWAKALRCPRIRTFAGHVPSREATSEQWAMAAAGLHEALQSCSRQGVALAVEIHNNTLADTADSLDRLLQASRIRSFDGGGTNLIQSLTHFQSDKNEAKPEKDRLNSDASDQDINVNTEIEFIYDGFNLYVDHLDPISILKRFYPWISHVHFKDYHWDHEDWGKSKAVPVLQGDADHKAIFDTLLTLGYKGFISFEYFGDQVVELVDQSLSELTDYMEKRVNSPD